MAQTHSYSAHLTWTGAAQGPAKSYATYSREHAVAFEGKPSVTLSADPHYKGDPKTLNPEELLLASLASCHMLTYLYATASKGVVVTAYEDRPEGKVTVQGGAGQFAEVTLHPRVTVTKGSDLALAKKLHEDAYKGCFIARSVNFPVHHEPEVVEE